MIVPAIFGLGNAATLDVAVAFLILFGLGWGFFDCNNMPILSQIVRPAFACDRLRNHELRQHQLRRARRLGLRRLLRDRHVPLSLIFGIFSGIALVSIFLVLSIRPKNQLSEQEHIE